MTDPTIVSLIETNSMLTMQLGAKQKRIEHLEFILEQRHIETRRSFDPDKIDEMKNKVYLLWLDGIPGIGFNYEEAQEEFYQKYRFRSACVPQRIRDLRQEGKLWSQEVAGKVTFYMKLKEATK